LKKISLIIFTVMMLFPLVLAGCEDKQASGGASELTEESAPVSDDTVKIELSPSPVPSENEIKITSSTVSTISEDLKKLLPSLSGFEWVYYGTAEYSHSMKIVSVTQNQNDITYLVKGAVEDISGGSSEQDLSLEISYILSPLRLYQVKKGSVMDSRFDTVELIREPLSSGSSWEQDVLLEDGSKTTLACSIESVRKVGGRNEYSVIYKDKNSSYYEKRKIREGFGVVAFERPDDAGSSIGYAISEPMSGYEGSAELNKYLPALDTEAYYNGLAEYAHKGTLTKLWSNAEEAVYEFKGEYEDGSGIPDKFVVRYYFDYLRGTVTEKAVSNTQGDKTEVNSKLHNLVILKYPLEKNASWSHAAKIDGKDVKVTAEVTGLDEENGTVTVKYTAQGVAGYYDKTYVEERTFRAGYGITAFSNLMPGDIGLSQTDAKEVSKLEEALNNHMFGYKLRDY
jgi:hypothetical protein